MKALIVDDERLARAELKRLLAPFPEVQVVGEAANADEAERLVEALAPDLLFLDMEPARLARALERLPPVAEPPAPTPRKHLERVFVRDGDLCWFVELRDVPVFESEGNYARLHLPGKQPLLARSLNYLEEHLDPEDFFRASRQHLVNLRWVEAVELGPGGRLVLRLRGGREVEMSRRQSQKFRERMSP
jgi:two-component system LytT family response regulator